MIINGRFFTPGPRWRAGHVPATRLSRRATAGSDPFTVRATTSTVADDDDLMITRAGRPTRRPAPGPVRLPCGGRNRSVLYDDERCRHGPESDPG